MFYDVSQHVYHVQVVSRKPYPVTRQSLGNQLSAFRQTFNHQWIGKQEYSQDNSFNFQPSYSHILIHMTYYILLLVCKLMCCFSLHIRAKIFHLFHIIRNQPLYDISDCFLFLLVTYFLNSCIKYMFGTFGWIRLN